MIEAWMRLGAAAARMNLAAAEVIARRTGMMATGAMSAPEAARMMLEKPAAFAEAARKAALAAASGAQPAAVASAAMEPIARHARANARRLRK
ncbi:MAG: antifreeze protein [Rubrimonas sp.]